MSTFLSGYKLIKLIKKRIKSNKNDSMNVSRYIYTFFVNWSPSKQTQCRFNAGPPPTRPFRHQISTANANTSCLSNSSSHPHGPTQQTQDAECQPNTGPTSRVCLAWNWAPTYTTSSVSDMRKNTLYGEMGIKGYDGGELKK